jgi:signal transduction histidine kinase
LKSESTFPPCSHSTFVGDHSPKSLHINSIISHRSHCFFNGTLLASCHVMSKAEVGLLNDAFFEFNRVSESLITHYSSLERRIGELKDQIEQKNGELERAQTYLHHILDSLPVGVVVLEGGYLPPFTNRRAQNLESSPLFDRMRDSASKVGEFKNGEGHFRWRKERLAGDFEGKEVLVVEDVTEVERMKERFERDERLRAMGEMAARISHEIKNPLGSMELFASMLLSVKLRKTDRKYIEYILFGVKAIDRIINNVLSYTRPRNLVLKAEPLVTLVNDTAQFMNISLESRNISITVKGEADQLSVFDPDLMKLVIMNLLINAMDAIGENGSISITVGNDLGYAVMSVSDDGSGMNEEVRKHLFDPFFTTKDKGLGLGLFIVYNIVKAHGGYIELESQVNCGSTFYVRIPEQVI